MTSWYRERKEKQECLLTISVDFKLTNHQMSSIWKNRNQFWWWLSHDLFERCILSQQSKMDLYPTQNVYSSVDSTVDPCCHPLPWMILPHELCYFGRLAVSGQCCGTGKTLKKQFRWIISSPVYSYSYLVTGKLGCRLKNYCAIPLNHQKPIFWYRCLRWLTPKIQK